MNTEHLISKPVCRFQDVSGTRQQNKVLDQIAGMDRYGAIDHVTQGSNRCTVEFRSGRIQRMTIRLEKVPPAKNHVPADFISGRNEIGKFRFGR
jgi:hypothetical protein